MWVADFGGFGGKFGLVVGFLEIWCGVGGQFFLGVLALVVVEGRQVVEALSYVGVLRPQGPYSTTANVNP